MSSTARRVASPSEVNERMPPGLKSGSNSVTRVSGSVAPEPSMLMSG